MKYSLALLAFSALSEPSTLKIL